MNYIIYGLYDDLEPDRIRYVGKSSGKRGVKDRIYHHKWLSRKSTSNLPSSRWIRKIGEERLRYRVLEIVELISDLDPAEIRMIAHYRSLGQADLNIASGGEGQTSERMSGSGNTNASTTWELVRLVREKASQSYMRNSEAAKVLGVNDAAASKILRNVSWTDTGYDPASRIGKESLIGTSPWRKVPDPSIEIMRSDYLSGMSLTAISKKWDLPLTSTRRFILQSHGSEHSLKLCIDESRRRSDKLNKR